MRSVGMYRGAMGWVGLEWKSLEEVLRGAGVARAEGAYDPETWKTL